MHAPSKINIYLHKIHITSQSLIKTLMTCDLIYKKILNYLPCSRRLNFIGYLPDLSPHFLEPISSITVYHSCYSSIGLDESCYKGPHILFPLSLCYLIFPFFSVFRYLLKCHFLKSPFLTYLVLFPNSHSSHTLPHCPFFIF